MSIDRYLIKKCDQSFKKEGKSFLHKQTCGLIDPEKFNHSSFFVEYESKDASEEESGSGSEGEETSASGSRSDDEDTQSQSTQDTADNSSLADITPEKRKWAESTGTEPKRRKVVDENLLRVPLQEG